MLSASVSDVDGVRAFGRRVFRHHCESIGLPEYGEMNLAHCWESDEQVAAVTGGKEGFDVQVILAVDVLEGRRVRLLEGDFDRSRGYSDDSVATVERWADEGAGLVHVVDLDGARTGESELSGTPGSKKGET